MWDTKGVTNAEAAGLAVPMKTSSGSTQKAVTELSSDSVNGRGCAMIQEGDKVVFLKDGVRGIVIRVEEDRCHVLWEDEFVSWEKKEWLRLEPMEKKEQRE
ncbi:hypothetical protein [Brevibacillus choshinensis]|uniref:Uncharacterized protein n=1 Tax=Brevibacillus choshinensis TaxID=54911 RepID=A0ABX7FYJ5_BRECH|nr:hypothetical protein [Brevibacillus choshinensis]QRG70867.1 hypothetical protein JNE38_09425 [Brevibacillus choshinensis]